MQGKELLHPHRPTHIVDTYNDTHSHTLTCMHNWKGQRFPHWPHYLTERERDGVFMGLFQVLSVWKVEAGRTAAGSSSICEKYILLVRIEVFYLGKNIAKIVSGDVHILFSEYFPSKESNRFLCSFVLNISGDEYRKGTIGKMPARYSPSLPSPGLNCGIQSEFASTSSLPQMCVLHQ